MYDMSVNIPRWREGCPEGRQCTRAGGLGHRPLWSPMKRRGVAFLIIMCAISVPSLMNAVTRCASRYATPSLLKRLEQRPRVASVSGPRSHRPSIPQSCSRKHWPPTGPLPLAPLSLFEEEDNT